MWTLDLKPEFSFELVASQAQSLSADVVFTTPDALITLDLMPVLLGQKGDKGDKGDSGSGAVEWQSTNW